MHTLIAGLQRWAAVRGSPGRGRWPATLAFVCAVLGLMVAAPASALTVISHSANTDVIVGVPFNSLEFENPLTGLEMVQGYDLIEWRDADYSLMGWPPSFDDWTVNDPFKIDGNVNEIWLRQRGHSAFTSTTVPGSIVSIHLVGDDNDGVAQVMVDGAEVARLDMNTPQPPQTACIIVKGLPNSLHNIEVHDLGPGAAGAGNDDVAIMGAGVLRKPVAVKWDQLPEDREPPQAWFGWNELSVHGGRQIAADDWRCDTEDPVTDIHWWGSFLNWTRPEPPPDMPSHFHIAIWTDVPAGQDEPWSHPGQVIWETDCYEFNITPEGFDFDPRDESFETCFRFDQVLNEQEWFRQTTQQGIYWISIAAVYPDGMVVEHPWGWKTRPRDPESLAPDDAVRIFIPTAPRLGAQFEKGEPIFWPSPEQSWDLAFELTTGGAGGNKVLQPPDLRLPGIHAHDWSGLMMREWSTLADDWICMGGAIVSFEWWGNYEIDELGREKRGQGIRSFHLSIHRNSWGIPYMQPGPELYGVDIPFSMVNETFTGMFNPEGSPIYHYEFVLPQPFPQEIEGWYWLDLTANSNSLLAPAYWRWQEHSRQPYPLFASAVQSLSGGPWKQLKWGSDPVRYTDLAFAVNSGISTAPIIKWSQPPVPIVPPGRFFNGWNERSVRGSDQIVADDWVCTGERPVTDIHWWGSFIGWSRRDPPKMPDAFEIAIWTDVPVGPGQPWSHPGRVIHRIICEDFRWTFAGWDVDPRNPAAAPEACFLFEQDLKREDWFWQRPGTNIYWISISAMYRDGQEPEYPWGWKLRPRRESPDDAVRIFKPTIILPEIPFQAGEPIFWPTERESWDAAFRLTSVLPGDLTFDIFKVVRDHFWWPRPGNPPNRMMSLKVSASATEAVFWDTITLQAGGTGNDAVDILSVDVYLDVNANGLLDAADVLLGSGAYPVDNGAVAIAFAAPPLIPAGGSVAALIVYQMNPAIGGPGGRTYWFSVVAASGTGQMTGAGVNINGLPLTSARKIAVRRPVPIGHAKKNVAPGGEVFLEGKVVTADFRNRFSIFYMEEPDRSAGIGVVPPPELLSFPLSIGDVVHVLGTTGYYEAEQTELIIMAKELLVEHPGAAPIVALKLNNRDTGGGVFGFQPAVVDDALPGPGNPRVLSQRLNNVGSLIETWGTVTGQNPGLGVFWLDDGSNLRDGNRLPTGAPAIGVAVLMPGGAGAPLPPVGSFLRVTGIMFAIPAGTPGDTYPMRLLVPRTTSDIIEVVGPGIPR